MSLEKLEARDASQTVTLPKPPPGWAYVMQPIGADAESICRYDIGALTQRFLQWPVPATECADPCASMSGYVYPRSGTNFLSADGARQMLEYVLSDAPTPEDCEAYERFGTGL